MPVPDSAMKSVYYFDHSPGSCSISWSKNGFICYATPASQGHNLNMTFLENINGSNWQLASPHNLKIKPLESSVLPTLHMVLWSNILMDLAVFDEYGNFYILLAGVGLLQNKNQKNSIPPNTAQSNQINANSSLGNQPVVPAAVSNSRFVDEIEGPSFELTSYNHAEMIYRDIVTPLNSTLRHNRCVAFEWLGIDKPQIINKPARLLETGSIYIYGVHLFQPSFLAHPITTKQACVALRQNGAVSLYYQGEHKVEYHKITAILSPSGAEGDLYFTHASFGFTADKKIILTAYDAVSRKILTYSISVDWGFLVESAVKQKSDPHFYTPKDRQAPPSLNVSLLHEMTPMPSTQAASQAEDISSDQVRLSLIDLLSPYYSPESTLDILISYEIITSDNKVYYTIQRFRVKDSAQLLNNPFSTIADAETTANERLYTLSLVDKITLPNKLEAIRTAISGSLVLLIHEDSTIIIVDRASWSLIASRSETEPSNATAHNPRPVLLNSLLDCEFTFPRLQDISFPFMFAVSPNLTGVVYLKVGSCEPAVFSTLHRKSNLADIRLLSMAFSHTHAHACYSNTSSDDLMALIQAEYDKLGDPRKRQELIYGTIRESHSAINFHLDSFDKQSVDKLLSNPPLQKLLSLQLAMSDLGQNRVSGDLAWIVLSLRSTSFGIMFSLSSIYRQMSKKKPVEDSMEDSISRAECIILLVGSVKWLIDLLIYLNQELLQLSLTRSNPEQSSISTKNSVVLPLLMSKVPRLFLMYAITSINKTHEILKKLHRDLSESNKLFTPMKEALERFFNTSNYLPLKMSNFESFLRECDDYIIKELSSKGADRVKLLHLEQQLFCNGIIPEDMISVGHNIIDRFSTKNSSDSRLSSLYFYDSRWLQIGATHKTNYARAEVNKGPSEPTQVRLQYSKDETIDALRKIFISCCSPIASGGATLMGQYVNSTYKLKKCVRCRSVSLVSDPLAFDSPKTIGLWTMVFQRNCICGSAWVNCMSSESYQ